MADPKILWKPSQAFSDESNLNNYRVWLAERYDLHFDTYGEMWLWSVENIEQFWESLCLYFNVIFHSDYEFVLEGSMPDCQWFKGATLSYAEHIFGKRSEKPAIIFEQEGQSSRTIGWDEMEEKVNRLIHFMKSAGVKKGDRVAVYLPNIPEASMLFLACNAIGAIWSSCSPDFGVQSVIDRFQQIEPKLFVAVDGYRYGGKTFDRREAVSAIVDALPTVDHVIDIRYLMPDAHLMTSKSTDWAKVMERQTVSGITFEPVEFDHPIWILYSSGTTGQPKAITHSTGGVLLEHLKYLAFHNDVKPGEKFFWYTTTGWMMWNFVQASWLSGATIMLYDGSPGYPDINVLWKFASQHRIEHFGTSAPYILSCIKHKLLPGKEYDLSHLRSISSTGAPLPPEGFSWVYQSVSPEIWLCSMSGGTDVCSAFVGGCPLEPLYEGEIQCRALGCDMHAWDDAGNELIGDVGEMVITNPMPSMPIYFWNDPDKKRYRESYFDTYDGVWRHGDWLMITKRGSLRILGRSDATLNRHGIRIGTAEIYRVVERIPGVRDSLVVNLEYEDGHHYMPLFLVLNPDRLLNDELILEIKTSLKRAYTPRHVPDDVFNVPEIPYTISGKKMEAPVKKILTGKKIDEAANLGAMKNPGSLKFFEQFGKDLRDHPDRSK